MVDDPRREIFYSQDGLQLVADRCGKLDAPAIVLLHGGGQTRHSWAGAMRHLALDGFQVINFDARGHGESDWSPTAAYSLDDRVRDLDAVVRGLRVPFLLVGASLGGATSIMAVHSGIRPAGLVLVDIVPEPDTRGIERILSFMRAHSDGFASIEAAAAAVAAYTPTRKAKTDNSGLTKNLRPGRNGRYYWHWDPRILDTSPSAHHALVQAATVTLGALPDLPVLLVRGLASDVVGDEGVAAFRRHVPHLEIFDVEGAGHMVAGDRNDVFNQGVIAFARRTLAAVPS